MKVEKEQIIKGQKDVIEGRKDVKLLSVIRVYKKVKMVLLIVRKA